VIKKVLVLCACGWGARRVDHQRILCQAVVSEKTLLPLVGRDESLAISGKQPEKLAFILTLLASKTT
jgi:hypothetical protein